MWRGLGGGAFYYVCQRRGGPDAPPYPAVSFDFLLSKIALICAACFGYFLLLS